MPPRSSSGFDAEWPGRAGTPRALGYFLERAAEIGATEALQRARAQGRRIIGVFCSLIPEELILALADLGYRFTKLPDWNGTLRAYVKQQPAMERASMIIASVPSHVLGLHYGMVFDNGNPKGCNIDAFQYRRRPVNHMYKIEKGPTT